MKLINYGESAASTSISSIILGVEKEMHLYVTLASLEKVLWYIMDEARDKVLFKKFILHSHAIYECTIYTSYND